jgi:hypothetical protein
MSCAFHPRVTRRSGFESMVVVPKVFSMLTGNPSVPWDVVDVPESEEHETSAVTAIAAAPRAVKPRREVFMKGSLTY